MCFLNNWYGFEDRHRDNGPHITPSELGIKIDKPDSNNGEIEVTYDWRKVEKYAEQWDDWFRHESREPEVDEIARHLNRAAKKAVDIIAAGQINVVKNVGKLAHAFSQWAEPGDQCDSEAFAVCLQGVSNGESLMHEVRHVGDDFHDKCARETDCR